MNITLLCRKHQKNTIHQFIKVYKLHIKHPNLLVLRMEKGKTWKISKQLHKIYNGSPSTSTFRPVQVFSMMKRKIISI